MSRWEHLRRGVVFASVCGGFGAAAWASVGLIVDGVEQALIAATVGFVMWGTVGFMIGTFGPADPRGGSTLSCDPAVVGRQGFMLVLGQFAYRTVVGVVIGTVGASIATVVAQVAVFEKLDGGNEGTTKVPRQKPPSPMLIASCAATIMGAFTGGMVGAWLCTRDGKRMSIWGSVWGLLLGSLCGALVLVFTSRGWEMAVAFGVGGAAGVLGGFIARGLLSARVSRFMSERPPNGPWLQDTSAG
jgi:hypothetical protein